MFHTATEKVPFSCKRPSREEQPEPPSSQVKISFFAAEFLEGKNRKKSSAHTCLVGDRKQAGVRLAWRPSVLIHIFSSLNSKLTNVKVHHLKGCAVEGKFWNRLT